MNLTIHILRMKLYKAIAAVAVAIIAPSIPIPNPVIAGSAPVEATYKQKQKCDTIPGSDARIEYYGWIAVGTKKI